MNLKAKITKDVAMGGGGGGKVNLNDTSSGIKQTLPMWPAGLTHFRQAATNKRKVAFTEISNLRPLKTVLKC